MFDNLVESSKHTDQAAKSSAYLGITTVLYAALALGIFVWSLYSVDIAGMGDEDLVLDTLVAPVPVPEQEPPPPPEDKPKEQPKTQEKTPENVDVRREIIASIDESPKDPPKINTDAQNFQARRQGVTTIVGDKNSNATSPAAAGPEREGAPSAPPPAPVKPPVDDTDEPPPPKPTPTPKPSPTPPKGPISGGVVNGKARSLVQPPYPPAAKAVKASGQVQVQVTIDESGNVISASAVSGHPLLRAAAVQAARSSKFSPTLLSGQPVKVTGVIVYNFNAQ